MVGSLTGTDSYFRADGYGGSESHFGVGYDGTVYQWQDTDYQAEANGAANARAISIETADTGTGFPKWTGSNVPPWNEAQLRALDDLVAWCCRTHDIPLVVAPDSRRSTRGVGYHRLGVAPYKVADGETWSSAYGKVCPGEARIKQIPGIVERARGHAPSPTPVKKGFPKVIERVLNKGSNYHRIICPVGAVSAIIGRAWVSISVQEGANFTVAFQKAADTDGAAPGTRPVWNGTLKNAHRAWAEIPSGTEFIEVWVDADGAGVVAVELESK